MVASKLPAPFYAIVLDAHPLRKEALTPLSHFRLFILTHPLPLAATPFIHPKHIRCRSPLPPNIRRLALAVHRGGGEN